jgi:transcriptional regulator with XRE-family HTH domain
MPAAHPRRPHLRAWRKHFAMTLDDLAVRLRIDDTTIGRWERQRIGVDDATFCAIARVYGITPAELSAPPGERDHAAAVAEVMQHVRALDTDAIRELASLARRLRGRSTE